MQQRTINQNDTKKKLDKKQMQQNYQFRVCVCNVRSTRTCTHTQTHDISISRPFSRWQSRQNRYEYDNVLAQKQK